MYYSLKKKKGWEDWKVSRGPLINWLFKPCDLLLSIMRSMAQRLNCFHCASSLSAKAEERLIVQGFVTSQGECRAVGRRFYCRPSNRPSSQPTIRPSNHPSEHRSIIQLSKHPSIHHLSSKSANLTNLKVESMTDTLHHVSIQEEHTGSVCNDETKFGR